MHTRHRRFLTATAAVTLASGLAVAGTPVGFAAPQPVAVSPGTQGRSSPVTVALAGVPGTLSAGGAPVEFTATLRNTADHRLDVRSPVFVLADTGAGTGPGHFRLEYRPPGGAEWQDARANGLATGGRWVLDRPAALSLAAGAEAVYRLRLTVTADAPAGRVTAGFTAAVSDPALPPDQHTGDADSGRPDLLIVPAVVPTAAPTTPAATAEVGFDGVPILFTVGGEAKPFRLLLANHSGKELRVVPAVVFRGEHELPADTVRFEFRAADGQWWGATPGGCSQRTDRLCFGLRAGDRDSGVITLANGGSRTVELRLAFTEDAPILFESLVAVSDTVPEPGEGAAESVGPAADFITVAATSATAAPAPAVPDPGPGEAAPEPSTAPVVTVAVPPLASSPADDAHPAAAAVPTAGTRLASTSGGAASRPLAVTGVAAIAMGIGTLVVARRRNRVRSGGN
ncbi:hypothetical protein ACWD4P_16320 [Kitasatospora sp. NPDC002543]